MTEQQIKGYLRMIYCDEPKRNKCIKTMKTIISNVINYPDDIGYREIRLANTRSKAVWMLMEPDVGMQDYPCWPARDEDNGGCVEQSRRCRVGAGDCEAVQRGGDGFFQERRVVPRDRPDLRLGACCILA